MIIMMTMALVVVVVVVTAAVMIMTTMMMMTMTTKALTDVVVWMYIGNSTGKLLNDDKVFRLSLKR